MAFTSDIQQKIIDFIKRSPIGVTSSEIANYFGLNRMTIIKYLAIIQQRALVDFKQLGMAKLWYIPVTLTREGYFDDMLIELAGSLSKDSHALIKKAGIKAAQHIDVAYRRFHGVETLSVDHVVGALKDAYKKIGGEFEIVERTNSLIILRSLKTPFGDSIVSAPVLWEAVSALCGVLVAKNLGYSRVEMKGVSENNPQERLFFVHLEKEGKKTEGEY
ncbi:MAG: HTH domain-containing protein [Nanoarchaeota archaeon]|nr:HTH domain-containing protein [Nanoarchaeota archaeon]